MTAPGAQSEKFNSAQTMGADDIRAAPGFWADAWRQVVRRPAAVLAIFWIGVVSIIAALAPILASGHPLIAWEISASGARGPAHSPLFERLGPADRLLLLGCVVGTAALLAPARAGRRSQRLGVILAGAAQAGLIVFVAGFAAEIFAQRDASEWARALERSVAGMGGVAPFVAAGIALLCSAPFVLIPSVMRLSGRTVLVAGVGAISGAAVWSAWNPPAETFDYPERERAGRLLAVYTLVPWSPSERPRDRDAKLLAPGSTSDQPLSTNLVTGLPISGSLGVEHLGLARARLDSLPLASPLREELRKVIDRHASFVEPTTRQRLAADLSRTLARSGRPYHLGTDSFGQDVLAQMIHACRLAVSIGLVSTGIATLIGVTLGALMGYFGGIIDLLLYRVVEIFMAVPLLFILIVAAGVLAPEYRSTHVMMAIIGCFTWTGAARYTRAEFYRLRSQDFVQAARAAGLPLRSILFRHMLPNGVTPVLVDASFAVAFAIILEATLSFLGLGPSDQASWGRLLADATGPVGDFVWWLAIIPGLAMFLAALSYNTLGEALRDAIDPKLKKARV